MKVSNSQMLDSVISYVVFQYHKLLSRNILMDDLCKILIIFDFRTLVEFGSPTIEAVSNLRINGKDNKSFKIHLPKQLKLLSDNTIEFETPGIYLDYVSEMKKEVLDRVIKDLIKHNFTTPEENYILYVFGDLHYK